MTRQELYDLVWSKPMTHIAKDFGMSDVAVRKHCKNMDIPTPPVGYWTKLEYGKKVRKPKLPTKKYPSDEFVHLMPRQVISRSPESIEAEERAKEEVAMLNALCIVPDELPNKLPPLVKSIRALLRKQKPDHHGMINIGYSYKPDISLGKESINRISRIFYALDAVASERGQKIHVVDTQ